MGAGVIYFINSAEVDLNQLRYEFILWLEESEFFSVYERKEMLIFLLDELNGLAGVW